MEFSNNKEVLTIFDKRGKVSTLATKLAALSGKQIKEFFDIRINKIPRQLNRLALMKVLNNKIQTLNSLSLPKDMFVKLQSYKDFTEFQMQTLFEKIGDNEDFLQYRINLWTLILRNYDVLNLMDGEVQHLTRIKKLPMDDFSSYNRALFESSLDVNKCFDGVPFKRIEEIFNNTFSSEELRRISEKYGFNIPTRLKKTEFSDLLKQILKSKKKLTVALSKEIDEMTVVQLNSLCEVHEVTLSSNLKKNELIFLLLFLIKKNKLSTSEITGISDNWDISPLEFTVDIDKIDNFGRGEAKEVIILPQEEQEEINDMEESEVSKDLTQEELLKEIAKKLGLIQEEDKKDQNEEVKKPTPKQKPKTQDTSDQISPAERLALARQRKQELALERKLEEERKALEAERKKFEEEKKIFEEQQALEKERKEKERLQEILNKLMNHTKEDTNDSIDDEETDTNDFNELANDDNEIIEDDFNAAEEYTQYSSESDIETEESIDDEFAELDTTEEVIEENFDDSEEDKQDYDESDIVTESEINDEIENVSQEDNADTLEDESNLKDSTSNNDDMLNETSKLQDNEFEVKDESYDENFNPLEEVQPSEVIENPYYKNKKFASKKKTSLKVFLIVLGAVLFFGAGLFASKFLK